MPYRPYKSKRSKLSKPYLAVLLISIISGGLVYAVTSGLVHIDGVIVPDKGSLAVLATYQGNYVIVTVQVTGPRSASGSTTTLPTSPLTFSDLLVGGYTVSGEYLSIPKSASVTVVKDNLVTVTLNFGEVVPDEFSFKKYHIIYTGVCIYWDRAPGPSYQPTDDQIRAEAQTVKSLGFTTVLTWDSTCDSGIYDDNPTQYREYRAFQIYNELGLYVIPQVGMGHPGGPEQTPAHLEKSAAWMKNFPNLIGIYFDDMNAAGPPDPTTLLPWIRQHFNIGRDYVILFGVEDTYSPMVGYVGQHDFAMLSYMYSFYSGGSFKGTGWVTAAANMYGDVSAAPYYTVSPFLDAFEVAVDPNMWEPQVDVAIQNHMLMLAWFLWYHPSLVGREGIKMHPDWYATVTYVNQKFHAYLDSQP